MSTSVVHCKKCGHPYPGYLPRCPRCNPERRSTSVLTKLFRTLLVLICAPLLSALFYASGTALGPAGFGTWLLMGGVILLGSYIITILWLPKVRSREAGRQAPNKPSSIVIRETLISSGFSGWGDQSATLTKTVLQDQESPLRSSPEPSETTGSKSRKRPDTPAARSRPASNQGRSDILMFTEGRVTLSFQRADIIIDPALVAEYADPIRCKSLTSKGSSYQVNLSTFSCNCPDFLESRSHFPAGSPARLCKHIVQELYNHSWSRIKRGIEDYETAAQIEHCAIYRHGMPVDWMRGRISIACGGDRVDMEAVFKGTPWINVYKVASNGRHDRFGFSVEEVRWARNRSPIPQGFRYEANEALCRLHGEIQKSHLFLGREQ